MKANRGYQVRACYSRGVRHYHLHWQRLKGRQGSRKALWQEGERRFRAALIGGCGKGKLERADWERPLDGMGLRSTRRFPWEVLSWKCEQSIRKPADTDQSPPSEPAAAEAVGQNSMSFMIWPLSTHICILSVYTSPLFIFIFRLSATFIK